MSRARWRKLSGLERSRLIENYQDQVKAKLVAATLGDETVGESAWSLRFQLRPEVSEILSPDWDRQEPSQEVDWWA